MILPISMNINDVIPEPYTSSRTNIDKTKPLFFHGTRKEKLDEIIKKGFIVNPERPVFTLNPVFSLAYCRKSESFLRGLIANNDTATLNKEIQNLKDIGVLDEKEDINEPYQHWIDKANKHYQSNENVIDSGVILAFDFDGVELVEPTHSLLNTSIKDGEIIIEGSLSYWRTRQFRFRDNSTHNILKFEIIELNQNIVDIINKLQTDVRKGRLSNALIIEQSNRLILGNQELKDKLITQTIESSLIRELRTILVQIFVSKGIHIFWNDNGQYLEDKRWSEESATIEDNLSKLRQNQYPELLQNYFEIAYEKIIRYKEHN